MAYDDKTGAHTEGVNTTASGAAAHAEGDGSSASNTYAHAEGRLTVASGTGSHCEGQQGTASGSLAHCEGWAGTASGFASHSEGRSSATNDYAHSEGYSTTAGGTYSHAEGYSTNAVDSCCHAEGNQTYASAGWSHAEGAQTVASEDSAHAEGKFSTASGKVSHAEGMYAKAIRTGQHAHAGGSFDSIRGQVQNSKIELRGVALLAGTTIGLVDDDSAHFTLENGKLYEIEIRCVATELDAAGGRAMWVHDLLVQQESGTITILNNNTTLSVPLATGWSFAVSVIPTPDRLRLTFTKPVTTYDVRVKATVRFGEISRLNTQDDVTWH